MLHHTSYKIRKQETAASLDFTSYTTVFCFPTVKDGNIAWFQESCKGGLVPYYCDVIPD